MRNKFGKILRGFSNCLLIAIVLLCLSIVIPKIMGYQVYNVISGSMEPAIPIGSAVYTREISPQDLQEGDIIAFSSQVPGGGVVTHRVLENDRDAQELITKGDANESPDFQPVPYSRVIGKMHFTIPVLGNLAAFITATAGKIIAGVIIGVAIVLNLAGSSLEKEIKSEGEANGEERPEQENRKKKNNPLIPLAFGAGIIILAVAGWNIYRIMSNYGSSNELYSGLQDTYTSENQDTDDTQWYRMVDVELEELQRENPDVVAWIFFENEDISYPVMYSGEDEKYLRTAFDGSAATAGSIFLEGANNPDFEDSHSIIYGHNMRNLSMFGKLKYYRSDKDYYADHAFFQIITGDKKYRYQIFAYEDVAEDSFVYQVPFAPGEEFQEFLDRLYRSSYADTNVVATSEDKIITLSTCSTTGRRFVVHGVRVDEYE